MMVPLVEKKFIEAMKRNKQVESCVDSIFRLSEAMKNEIGA